MTNPRQTALFEKNRKAFEEHYPIVWRYLQSRPEPVSRLVVEDDGAVNVDLGKTRLYPEPAEAWTEKQIAAYFEEPDRIGFSDPGHCNLSPVSRRVMAKLSDYMAEHGDEAHLESYPVVDVGFAFVFGIGLGFHVRELVRRGVSRSMVLVEPISEFLVHSLSVLDWAEVFELAAEQRIQLEFLLDKPPTESTSDIERFIYIKRQTFLEGSHAYVHYPSWALQEGRRLLNEKIKTFYMSWGYFEDELLMMRNAYHNLLRWDLSLIPRKRYMAQEVPVFVVGSGPSLDTALPVIQAYQDRVVVVSCGTSLGILLKNGVRPDYHVETENTLPLVDNLRRFSETYGLEGITLVASVTVPPDVGRFFDKRWYFHRSFLSSSTLLNGDIIPLPGVSPLVANAGFGSMAVMGFREIYLMGVDCGRKAEHGHHAKDAVYYQEDYDNYLPGEGFEQLENEFTIEVPGNFGGTALTTWYLDMSRAGFSNMLHLIPDVRLYNCGDGARIDGAAPRAPAGIKVASTPEKLAAAKARVESQLPHFSAGAFLDTLDFDGLIAGVEALPEALDDALAAAQEDGDGFFDLDGRIRTLLEESELTGRAVRAIANGSIVSLIRLGAFAGTRIPDEAKREAFFRFFLGHFREAFLWMTAEVGGLLREIKERKPTLSPFGEWHDD